MDKQNNVSIRLNGEEKTFTDQANDEVAATSEDFQDWNELQPSELMNENKIVDLGKKRKRKGQLSLPFWDDGKRDRGPKLPPKNRKKQTKFARINLSFFTNTVVISVISAIIVGGAFGMMLLSLFTGESSSPSVSEGEQSLNGSAVEEPQTSVPSFVAENGVPAVDIHLVQAGAFSTSEKGNEMRETLQSDGVPSVLTENHDPHFLFIGVGKNREAATALSEFYGEAGVETYVKPYAVVATGLDLSNEWTSFMTLGVESISQVTDLSVRAFTGEAIPEGERNEMIEVSQAWQESINAIDEQSVHYELARTWFDESAPAFQQFTGESLTRENAITAQQVVLQSVLYYENLINALHSAEEASE
ncbi:hypothetical protein LGQ02_14720 [Bacillus shivajii]|uniref:hypothetical protein n=1 Tax=Bacillus shivajii TaxID=1983719 RepID=UPI001CFB26D0|nr:hypothetical protein [Bacillus shivajii]UCZ52092.1 hypothetical protein LGQ02_14720 [Bacillus shivajii]